MSNSQEFVMSDLQCKDNSCPEEQDWKALYQMTSNWYRGRAKGYCPLMLPSLTTLASATRALSDRSGLGLGLDSRSNPGTRIAPGTGSGTTTGAGRTDTILPSPCTPAQVAIQRLLKRRKPVAVIGLQHEGSSLTAVSLAKIPVDPGAEGQVTELSRIQLLRSNPHYREKKSSSSLSSDQLSSSTGTSIASTSGAKPPNPNIMMQDPRRHENVSFAIRTATPPPATTTEDSGVDGPDVTTGLETGQQHSSTSSIPLPPSGQPTLSDLANDILCHYSSPLHSFLVTGHMDGIVRLWDLSIREPGRQCIRYWQTGPRRRVLCVGMNSKVVVCGNVDSTICVWDIHPSPGSSSSTHGTIHTASYMTSRAPQGLDDWISGIEHICVGDSLVACSTEFSGSVLVFSLGTGSLVYEIPGLYQPSKMCMTDFFLLTGGRGAWNQGGTHRRLNQLGQAQGEQAQQRGKKQAIRTTSYSPMVSMTQPSGRWTMPPSLSAASTNNLQLEASDDFVSSSSAVRDPRTSVSPLSPQQPISAPLTLLDIAVTPDHSTLVVTLCERSGEGLEGVYCWDFGGSRLEGYHEEAPDVSTMIMDQNDLEYRTVANTVLADDHDEDDDGFLDDDNDHTYSDSNDDEDVHGGGRVSGEDDDNDRYSNDRIHNNMVMQQVDSTVLRDLHQARVTGKLWIGWKLDERQFLRRKEGAMARANSP
ncbi:hypothetical protein BGZ89_005423 [Linnemannia elongata]|nr:hypothetical protein BGZ89_005423 [Linnemannia elongata]